MLASCEQVNAAANGLARPSATETEAGTGSDILLLLLTTTTTTIIIIIINANTNTKSNDVNISNHRGQQARALLLASMPVLTLTLALAPHRAGRSWPKWPSRRDADARGRGDARTGFNIKHCLCFSCCFIYTNNYTTCYFLFEVI